MDFNKYAVENGCKCFYEEEEFSTPATTVDVPVYQIYPGRDMKRTDREYYLNLCAKHYDKGLSLREVSDMLAIDRWIQQGKPEQGKAHKAAEQDKMTDAERWAEYARMDERDQRGKSWRGD